MQVLRFVVYRGRAQSNSALPFSFSPLKSDAERELGVQPEDALEEDGPLGGDDREEHREGDRGEAVPPQERHQEPEAAEQHQVHVQSG